MPLTIYQLPVTTYSLPLTICHLLLTTYHFPLTPYHSLLTAHCSLLTAHCSLLIAYCSLLTAHGFNAQVQDAARNGGVLSRLVQIVRSVLPTDPSAQLSWQEGEVAREAVNCIGLVCAENTISQMEAHDAGAVSCIVRLLAPQMEDHLAQVAATSLSDLTSADVAGTADAVRTAGARPLLVLLDGISFIAPPLPTSTPSRTSHPTPFDPILS